MGLIKTEDEIAKMRVSCKIVSDVLKHIKQFIVPGITTAEIDKIIENFIISRGGKPAFKGYGGGKNPFPASACVSVNEEVVHGIPGNRMLKEGDIVSVDVGVLKDGYYGDAAYTYSVGEISEKKKKLLLVTEESLYEGIAQAVPNNTINDIACAIQNYVEGKGFSVVRELVGHGIGSKLHEEPAVPNYYSKYNTQKLYKGMTLAIEPMVNSGTYEIKVKADGWTTVTKDGEPSAHFEHTILITNSEPEILTL
jgi:methionyl aminopeptidase